MSLQIMEQQATSQSSQSPDIHWSPKNYADLDTDANTSSVTSNDPDESACQTYFFITYTLLMGCLCIIGVVLNALCFAVFCRDKINTSTTFFFKALAVVDSGLLIVAFPIFPIFHGLVYINAYTSSGYYSVYHYLMVYVWPWTLVTQTANVWLIMLIGVSRYIAVCRPYNACRLCTIRQARRQLAVVLVAAVIYNLPRFFAFRITPEVRTYLYSNQTVTIPVNVTLLEAQETALYKVYWFNVLYNNVAYFIFLLFVPLVVLSALNYLLIRALAKMRRRRASMQSAAQQQDTSVTLVLVVLVVIFIVCELPALVQQVLRNILPEESLLCGGLLFYLRPISNVLVTLNSVVNFFVYVTFNTRFRQHFIEMMMCGRVSLSNGSERVAKYATTGSAACGVSYSRVNQPLSTMNVNSLKPPMTANDANTLSECDQGGGHVTSSKV